MEFILNNKIYCKFVCDNCNNEFNRRKGDVLKALQKNNNKNLCCKCMRAMKYVNKTHKKMYKMWRNKVNK